MQCVTLYFSFCLRVRSPHPCAGAMKECREMERWSGSETQCYCAQVPGRNPCLTWPKSLPSGKTLSQVNLFLNNVFSNTSMKAHNTLLSGELMMSLFWYYRPEHTQGGRNPSMHCEVSLELFMAQQCGPPGTSNVNIWLPLIMRFIEEVGSTSFLCSLNHWNGDTGQTNDS